MSTQLKEHQLETLIRTIVKQLLNEYSLLDQQPSSMGSSLSSAQDTSQSTMIDPNNSIQQPMSNSDRIKLDRIKKSQSQNAIKQGTAQLSQKKKELDFETEKMKQMKRFELPSLEKNLQQLKMGGSSN